MSARLLDGRATAAKVKERVKQAVSDLIAAGKAAPGLSVILVGENPASAIYVKHKQAACEAVGIQSTCHRLPVSATEADIANQIQMCNEDPNTHGILLQLPLPEGIDPANLLELINPKKDVDGFHPYNLGRLTQRNPTLRPCTPHGVITLLKDHGIELSGKDAVVVGASNIVGRPMALEFLLSKCTVTVCHRFTQDLKKHVQAAQILVVATGKPGLINSDWIQPGTVVVDVGFSRLENGTITGDVDFESAKERAAWITPVPGGVGPMTVATLLENTLAASEGY